MMMMMMMMITVHYSACRLAATGDKLFNYKKQTLLLSAIHTVINFISNDANW
jgi:hypothetical protein